MDKYPEGLRGYTSWTKIRSHHKGKLLVFVFPRMGLECFEITSQATCQKPNHVVMSRTDVMAITTVLLHAFGFVVLAIYSVNFKEFFP